MSFPLACSPGWQVLLGLLPGLLVLGEENIYLSDLLQVGKALEMPGLFHLPPPGGKSGDIKPLSSSSSPGVSGQPTFFFCFQSSPLAICCIISKGFSLYLAWRSREK